MNQGSAADVEALMKATSKGVTRAVYTRASEVIESHMERKELLFGLSTHTLSRCASASCFVMALYCRMNAWLTEIVLGLLERKDIRLFDGESAFKPRPGRGGEGETLVMLLSPSD